MSEEDKVASLLNGLVKSFDTLVVSLESKEGEIEFDYVAARLVQEELRQKENQEDDSLFMVDARKKEVKIEK